MLATVLDRKTGYGSLNGEYTGFKADIASATDYYPFGMEMPGRTISSEKSRFGFNGQEKDNEVAGVGVTTEFRYRSYDARIGRFKSMDPLFASYPWNSTYAFAENRVIDGVDLEGLEYAWAMDKLADKMSGSAPVVAGMIRGLAPFTGAPGVDDAINAVTNLVSPPPPASSKDIANKAINSIPFVYGVRKIAEGGDANVAEGITNIVMTGVLLKQGAKSNSVKGPDFKLKYKPSPVEKVAAKMGANIGTKLEYVFGKATGSAHNIERSTGMLRQLESVGIFDDAAGRALLNSHFQGTYNSSIGILQSNGRYLRESLLLGPRGALKVESIWEGNKLITVKLLGGK